MQDLFDKALVAFWGIWRFRWIALLVAWFVCLSGWLLVGSLEHRYRASARVSVDSNNVLEPLLRGIAVQPDVQQRVALMSKALLTRPNLEKLMRMTDLDIDAKTALETEQLLDELKARIGLGGGRRNESIYTVTYAHKDPVMAKRVVQSLITIFIENSLGDERKDSQLAQSFLDKQIAEYEDRLVEAETRLSSFRRENSGTMPGEAGGYYQRLELAVAQQRTASLALREASNRRNEIARQIENERPIILGDAPGSGGSFAQQSRIQVLQDQLDSLLVRYTDRHPQVSQLRETIRELETEQQQASVTSRSDAERARNLQTSAVYQSMRTMLAESDARVAELQVRVADFDEQVVELKDTVDSIPQVEAQLQQLDRDYETVKRQHATLLERRESARLSEQVEQNSDDVKFQVIDPPFVPSKPSSPNKKLLNLMVLAAGVGAGVGLGFLLSLLRPIFHNQRSLFDSTGLPVFGSVTLIESKAIKLRRLVGSATYSSLFAALIVLFGGVMFMQSKGIGLEQLAQMEQLNSLNQFRNSSFVQQVENSGVVVKLTKLIQGQ